MIIKFPAADNAADNEIAAMAGKLKKTFSAAAADEHKLIREYWALHIQRDAQMREQLAQGIITQQQYSDWMMSQIGRGKRMEQLRDKLAERAYSANQDALLYINGEVSGIYTYQRNYAAYTIERYNGSVGFDMWNEQAVRELVTREPDLMPEFPAYKAIDRGIDMAFSQRQIQQTITQSILMGRGVEDTAESIVSRLQTMGYTSAMRAARTATTAAQNGGRYAANQAAVDLGVKLQNMWVCVMDSHTRDSHRDMDGEKAEVDAEFSNGLKYPGDPSGEASEVYNCRCSLCAWEPDSSLGLRRVKMLDSGKSELIEYQTYREWEAAKKAESPELWEAGQKMAKNRSPDEKQFEEYRKIAGSKCPTSFKSFQELKYTDAAGWADLKGEVRKRRG